MAGRFTITIRNQTGMPQDYKLISTPPKVAGAAKPKIWSSVFQSADRTSPSGQARFDITRSYNAIVGVTRDGSRGGAQLSVSQSAPVALGRRDESGNVPGSTVSLKVFEGSILSFGRQDGHDSAYVGCFGIGTGNDFTASDAERNNFAVGVGMANGNGQSLPIAIFTPKPGCNYQIEPVNTFYVCAGVQFDTGSLIDITQLGRSLVAVDFTRHPANTVTITHKENGELTL